MDVQKDCRASGVGCRSHSVPDLTQTPNVVKLTSLFSVSCAAGHFPEPLCMRRPAVQGDLGVVRVSHFVDSYGSAGPPDRGYRPPWRPSRRRPSSSRGSPPPPATWRWALRRVSSIACVTRSAAWPRAMSPRSPMSSPSCWAQEAAGLTDRLESNPDHRHAGALRYFRCDRGGHRSHLHGQGHRRACSAHRRGPGVVSRSHERRRSGGQGGRPTRRREPKGRRDGCGHLESAADQASGHHGQAGRDHYRTNRSQGDDLLAFWARRRWPPGVPPRRLSRFIDIKDQTVVGVSG